MGEAGVKGGGGSGKLGIRGCQGASVCVRVACARACVRAFSSAKCCELGSLLTNDIEDFLSNNVKCVMSYLTKDLLRTMSALLHVMVAPDRVTFRNSAGRLSGSVCLLEARSCM